MKDEHVTAFIQTVSRPLLVMAENYTQITKFCLAQGLLRMHVRAVASNQQLPRGGAPLGRQLPIIFILPNAKPPETIQLIRDNPRQWVAVDVPESFLVKHEQA